MCIFVYREVTNNGKFKYIQTFKDNTGRSRRVSVVKNNKTRATEKEAYEELQAKIREILNSKRKLLAIILIKIMKYIYNWLKMI